MPGKTPSGKFGLVLTLLVLALYLIFGASVPALATARGTTQRATIKPSIKEVMHQFSTQDQIKALAYWTPARMKSAISIDSPAKTQTHAPDQQIAAGTGSAKSTSPFVPRGMHVYTPGKGMQSNAYQLPQSFYQYFPFSTVGKVFFTQNGIGYVCSGTAVNSNNKSEVDTAGHCVIAGSSGNHWSSNWVFCPQYYYGNCPYGEWTARQLWTTTDWADYGWLEEDYGEANMSPNGYGDVVNVVGGSGSAWNYDYGQYFEAFGYPAESPFDGNTMWDCPSSFYSYDFPSPGGAPALGISCNMTGGCSGGAWFISIGNTYGYVNGHNDYKHNGDANHLYSPYYGDDWYTVYNAAQNS